MPPTEQKQKKRKGGARPGAGRKPGQVSQKTLEKQKMKEVIDQRFMRMTDSFVNAQALLATGQTFLYKIEKEWIKTGETKGGKENGYWRNKKPVQVTVQSEIEDYLEHLVDLANGDVEDEFDPAATYYFLTTKEPNNEALKDIFNRVHGKPKESLEVDVNHTFSLKKLAEGREQAKKLKPSQYKVLPAATEVPAQEAAASSVQQIVVRKQRK